ncbi:hypothetical protein [Streptomyces mexicanus]|uniref:hypothetical protein n=1 Tax=Streptomyces mexicanus TaxID=178566 RepID=UPI0031EFDE95
MGEQPKRRQPQLARTDFESMTHEQLAAMLESAGTAGASHLSTKLAKAASTITKIGDDLMQYVKGLEWQGEGGDAFRDWGGQTASATLRLGQYAEVASRWMATVSQAIAEAKSAMPDTSETTKAKADLAAAHKTIAAANEPGAHHDPDARKAAQTAQSDATAAQHRIEAARAEAIQQMRKLAQTYEYSAQQVNSVTPPTFSPPADNTGSDSWWRDGGEHLSVGGPSTERMGSDPAAHASGAHDVQARASTPTTAHTVSHRVGSHAASPTDQPAQRVSLDLDGTELLSRPSAPSPTIPTAPQTGVPHQELPVTGQPSLLPPAFSSGGPVGGNRYLTPRLPSPSQAPQGAAPGGGVAGRAPRSPRESGIVGGRPVSSGSGRPQNSIGRGTVIGKESMQGRTGVPRGLTAQGPAAGGTGSAKGMASGRRLASESGGVVGSRQVQAGRTGGRPFTPGGSGLVRPASNSAAAPGRSVTGRAQTPAASTQSAGSRTEREKGQRPEYLVEDEETWVRGDRRSLPPVVD